MANPKNKADESFPWWYSWVKWMLPLGLAIAAGGWVGLTLTGIIPAFGMLKWAPVFYASLEGAASYAVLSLTSLAVASLVGFASILMVRSGLFQVAENVATKSLHRTEDLENQLGELTKEFKSLREESDKALDEAIKERKEVETQYYEALGRKQISSKPNSKRRYSALEDEEPESPKKAANDNEEIKTKRAPLPKRTRR